MLMNEGLDTGDILLQEETDIQDDDTAESLGRRLSGIGASLLLRTIDQLETREDHPCASDRNSDLCPPSQKRGRQDRLVKKR